jgi:hypothetical protein
VRLELTTFGLLVSNQIIFHDMRPTPYQLSQYPQVVTVVS